MGTPMKVIFRPTKSLVAAVLMPLFLGPIGLLYSSFLGAIVMLFLLLLCIPLGQKGGGVAVMLWVIGVFWSVFSANRYNKKWLKPFLPTSTSAPVKNRDAS